MAMNHFGSMPGLCQVVTQQIINELTEVEQHNTEGKKKKKRDLSSLGTCQRFIVSSMLPL